MGEGNREEQTMMMARVDLEIAFDRGLERYPWCQGRLKEVVKSLYLQSEACV